MSNRDKRAQRPPRRHGRFRPSASEPGDLCAYCGIQPSVNGEHVVARAFFGKPYPQNPIVVPACRDCNAGMSLDEDYVRTVFCSEYFASRHPTAEKLLREEIRRSMQKQPRFSGMLAAQTEPAVAQMSSGLILPNVLALHADRQRIARVLTKIVRGLFYAGCLRRLPPERPVLLNGPVKEAPFRALSALIDRMPRRSPWITVGDHQTFAFKTAMQAGADSVATVWLLAFYRRHVFFAHTLDHAPDGTILPTGQW